MTQKLDSILKWGTIAIITTALATGCSSDKPKTNVQAAATGGQSGGTNVGGSSGLDTGGAGGANDAGTGGTSGVSTLPTLYLVGDSTVAAFTDAYYYPRYGYGTQIAKYLNQSIVVVNLAASGRSSKSFAIENTNYAQLTAGLKAGDYVMIGFGHNDEKADPALRVV